LAASETQGGRAERNGARRVSWTARTRRRAGCEWGQSPESALCRFPQPVSPGHAMRRGVFGDGSRAWRQTEDPVCDCVTRARSRVGRRGRIACLVREKCTHTCWAQRRGVRSVAETATTGRRRRGGEAVNSGDDGGGGRGTKGQRCKYSLWWQKCGSGTVTGALVGGAGTRRASGRVSRALPLQRFARPSLNFLTLSIRCIL
jgi:hypothetical protein